MVLDSSWLNTQQYKVRIKSKVEQSDPGKWVAPSPTPWFSSYWKGSLLVALDSGQQLFFFLHLLNNIHKVLYVKIFHLFMSNIIPLSKYFDIANIFIRKETLERNIIYNVCIFLVWPFGKDSQPVHGFITLRWKDIKTVNEAVSIRNASAFACDTVYSSTNNRKYVFLSLSSVTSAK